MLGSGRLEVAVRHRREHHEPGTPQAETLLVDTALAQQYRLPTIQQGVHDRGPLLERQHGDRLPRDCRETNGLNPAHRSRTRPSCTTVANIRPSSAKK